MQRKLGWTVKISLNNTYNGLFDQIVRVKPNLLGQLGSCFADATKFSSWEPRWNISHYKSVNIKVFNCIEWMDDAHAGKTSTSQNF